ncbi:MAG: cache domain-containing protein [Pseudomonadota bacterium]
MRSVRFRLLILALAPMVLLMPLLLFVGMTRWTADYDRVLVANVESDLRIAEQYLSRLMVETGEQLEAVAGSTEFNSAAQSQLTDFFADKKTALTLDFLYYLTLEEAAGPAQVWPVIAAARDGSGQTEIDIFSTDDLSMISPDLAIQASLTLIETEAAVPTERTVEDRGMVIHSAVPVRLPDRTGVLVGGVLLNRNLAFIDTINTLVYTRADTGGSRQGTATLFLEDVRVSTNVRLFEDVRALGTRVSAAVRDKVLGEGQTWLNRAFVVNDWYISGYLPLRDSFGNYVGMLYVGFLEEPFNTAKRNAFVSMFVAFSAVVMISVPLFLWLARGVFAPLERMTRTIAKVQAGDLSARNGRGSARDEVGQVAGHLDNLLDRVQERDEQLNARVDARTAELSAANEKLEETFRQLVMSEKLASIGEITAGVAHEINNPVAVIQGNLDVIRETLGVQSEGVKTELGLIDRQIVRIQTIVGKLLQFARPGEFADLEESVPIEPVVMDCLVLVDHVIAQGDIKVVNELEPAAKVRVDPGELQQVLVNLILNAAQAMGGSGTLLLRCADEVRDDVAGVRLTVCDSGPGIPSDLIDHVFTPFYTTKQSQGTGLGLSISQTLIQRAGGIINARNRTGGGACFEIWLPAAD